MTSSALKILVTGGAGQLASALQAHPRATHFELSVCSRNELDITRPDTIAQAIAHYSPDVLINTAAFTAVDLAESHAEQAMQANHDGAQNLAQACEAHNIPLLHLSTDYIFDGNSTRPYTEEDEAQPINVYGQSKWLGEQAIRQYCEKHIILRVSGVFSTYGKNFYKTILHLAQTKPELRIVSDQITCPTFAPDIADALFTLSNNKTVWGTFHFCSTPQVSWYEFATAIVAQTKKWHPNITASIIAISTDEYPTAAKRPKHSVLNCEKIKATFAINQPSWRDALAIKDFP